MRKAKCNEEDSSWLKLVTILKVRVQIQQSRRQDIPKKAFIYLRDSPGRTRRTNEPETQDGRKSIAEPAEQEGKDDLIKLKNKRSGR